MTEKLHRPLSALRRLVRDEGGNTLIITAFLLFPMIGMIGSGVDMSRAYMVKTRLQAACDAGVLAGRKGMGQVGTYDAGAKAKADKMFNFNFDVDGLAVNTTSFATSANTDGQVNGTASTKLPTLIMKAFGKDKFDLAVTCSAELQIANADIMFVLDTTGSMAWCPDGNTSCSGGPTSRIAGIREAVIDFHKSIADAVTYDDGTRIRYGFVPYSSSINVGGLIGGGLLPLGYIANNADYQTRNAKYDTPQYTPKTAWSSWGNNQTHGSNISNGDCDKYGNNLAFSGFSPNPSGNPSPPAATVSGGAKPADVTTINYRRVTGSYSGSKSCTREKRTGTTTYSLTAYGFTTWVYGQRSIKTSAFKTGSAATMGFVSAGSNLVPTGTVTTAGIYDPVSLLTAPGAIGVQSISSSWEGCIEERATVNDLAMSPVPSGAKDLDINAAPTNDATRWKPLWGDVEYLRFHGSTPYNNNIETTFTGENGNSNGFKPINAACPTPMMAFRKVDTKDSTTAPTWLTTYLNSLTPLGGTYHDLGMIWGARLGSPRGLFKSNVDNGEVDSVSRHIIFMTDGEMAPTTTQYSAYGLEHFDNRVAPSGTSNATLTDFHSNRFLAACELAKAEGYTVWTVSFGTGMTANLRACSSDNRAYESSSTAALKTAFKAIASQIADLRLNK